MKSFDFIGNGLKTRDDVKHLVKELKIQKIILYFTDINGTLKGLAKPSRELDDLLEGVGFDGSSVDGFVRIEESDLIAMPDISTFRIYPFEETQVMMLCDILYPNGDPYESDPRYVLRKNLEYAQKKFNFDHFYVGPELEYYYFKAIIDPQSEQVIGPIEPVEPLDEGNYFDHDIHDPLKPLRDETSDVLEKAGIQVEYDHHEVGPSQHEIDLVYQDALKMADSVMMYKMIVKKMAQLYGVWATFHPKPIEIKNGSGMHVHQSLFKGNKNTFFDKNDPLHISKTAKQYMQGLIEKIREITLVLNQWNSSYKRIVPGFEAPAYICWGQKNRSALIRVPYYKPGKEKATRLELRSPDPTCNPYFAFSVMLRAGLYGIENNLKPSDAVEIDTYKLSRQKREELQIFELPSTMEEAINLAQNSDFLKDVFGEDVFNKFIKNRIHENLRYCRKVTDYDYHQMRHQ